jgi:hypothetical protein
MTERLLKHHPDMVGPHISVGSSAQHLRHYGSPGGNQTNIVPFDTYTRENT